MSTFPFVPNPVSPFIFNPVLDGRTYAAEVTWNLFGQRWYLAVNELTGDLVFARPLTGAPDGTRLQSLSWAFGTATAVTALPHRYTVGQTIELTISGCAPAAYNGSVSAFVVDDVTLTYPIAADPGDATQLGVQTYNLNLAAGYFTSSTLIYRESTQTFEVTP